MFAADLPSEQRLIITGNADDSGAYSIVVEGQDKSACIRGTGFNAQTAPMPHNGGPL